MDHFIKELQENDNFHDYNYMYFVKFRKKNIGIHNMAVLYPNLCYNEACYKGAALYDL